MYTDGHRAFVRPSPEFAVNAESDGPPAAATPKPRFAVYLLCSSSGVMAAAPFVLSPDARFGKWGDLGSAWVGISLALIILFLSLLLVWGEGIWTPVLRGLACLYALGCALLAIAALPIFINPGGHELWYVWAGHTLLAMGVAVALLRARVR